MAAKHFVSVGVQRHHSKSTNRARIGSPLARRFRIALERELFPEPQPKKAWSFRQLRPAPIEIEIAREGPRGAWRSIRVAGVEHSIRSLTRWTDS